ncbi:beta-galactosidase GalB [Alkaliflexus imshenetskii]|uniref:beta-galactosidase GalB n=1 Tax=Alkaliflexus imshenetskii TaxID=286730 RepID=UPI00047D9E23|nr:beta-galactosidase GalB [Alkaliflexus imshenetskii]
MRYSTVLWFLAAVMLVVSCKPHDNALLTVRYHEKFNDQWLFHHGDTNGAYMPAFEDVEWESVDLPHDWSITEPYHIDNPGGFGTSFMIGGIGWYRKSFLIPENYHNKRIEITFDGIYQNSTVWVNGHELGTRPFGYISFRYDLTPYITPGVVNTIVVKVDNSLQPNSRWYSGSGIYRNVWLTVTDKLYLDPWELFVTTPAVDKGRAEVSIESVIKNSHDSEREFTLLSEVYDAAGNKVSEIKSNYTVNGQDKTVVKQVVTVRNPELWSVDAPTLYTLRQSILSGTEVIDDLQTRFGIRYFNFDAEKGFFLNGEPLKIKGVCMHHDLGALGAAVNVRAMQRQLEILKEMGCNGIRTAHNPPAPELLHLCDEMGFIVMNETFDMWKLPKTTYDYSLYWDEWHERDLRDHIMRDRNHPSVFIWSIGNEILEQWQPQGSEITTTLAAIVKALDPTRPVTAGNNHAVPENFLIQSGALDLIGYNYKHETYADFPNLFPGKVFIATETTSALATRGSYDMPSDSIRRWPYRWDVTFTDGNADNSCSAYDNCSAPWGSTHAETWKVVRKHDFLSGMYIWTGFDYLGEPTPYEWPSRSSYFGVIDLAGFPKDAYFMYQSEWTNKTVLHLFPHWNWDPGQMVDVWAYYNNADEVELFLNGVSKGVKSKSDDDLHVWWRLPFEPGKLRAVSRKNGVVIKETLVSTAGEPAQIVARVDRATIQSGGEDLAFITIEVLDENGILVPYADNLIYVKVSGNGSIAAVDNGSQTNHQPFVGEQISAFHGKCLVVVRAAKNPGVAVVSLSSDGLHGSTVEVRIN